MSTRGTTVRSPAQQFALVAGVIYLLIGILGFSTVTGADDKLFDVFGINLLHNIVHLAVGAAFLIGSSTRPRAKKVNFVVGILYGIVALLGFANILIVDLLDLNAADNFLHLASAVLSLYFGTAGAEGARPAVT